MDSGNIIEAGLRRRYYVVGGRSRRKKVGESGSNENSESKWQEQHGVLN